MTSSAGRPPEPQPFDITGPLPSGVTLLEASAGTGKTYTIAALVARFVADGVGLDRLLVVTFTRMATGELRERVRERLLSAEEGLARVIAGGPLTGRDEIVDLLAAGPAAEVARRHQRLADAVAGFDAATIETTHGFCLRVLTGLGVAGDIEPDTTLEPDVADLIEEVVDDLYVRRFWPHDTSPTFSRKIALQVGRAVTAHPSAALAPPRTEGPETWAMRRRLADAVRSELDRRKRAAKVLTYDDVLIQLRATLLDPVRGPRACDRLRARYQVALIDEFQDTDPVQWDIVRSAFGHGDSTLVLIGDPKQAIYAFRGADVHAYLDAAEQAGSEATLGTNWRSDQVLLDAYDALLAGTRLGDMGIVYREVRAARPGVGLVGLPAGSPLRIRIARRDSGLVGLTPKGMVAVGPGRPFIATDVAADVSQVLQSGATVRLPADNAGDAGEPVRPGHIAVLVRTNAQAEMVRHALHAAGVPAVVGGSASVFAEPAATAWRRLLDALEQPTSPSLASSVALTSFIGWTAEQVATADADTWEDLHWRLHRWSALLRRRGVAALMENITVSQHLPARTLVRPGGERELSDMRHIGELLHAAATSGGLGAAALGAWLRSRIADARTESGDEDRTRRLESDAEAVQVLTIHRAKGLEFPIVYCPYLWDENTWDPPMPVFHDPTAGGVRTIDVGGDEGPDYHAHCAIQLREERGEDLRLLYVALTRARHQAVVWWAGSKGSADSPLGRLLFARDADGVIDHQGRGVPDDDDVAARITELATAAGADIAVEEATGGPVVPWEDRSRSAEHLEVAGFDRQLDDRWSRTSYSGITASTHGPVVGSEPETDVVNDERSSEASYPPPDDLEGAGEDLRSVPLLLTAMTGGARVGTIVHRVLERLDFTSSDLSADLRTLLDAELERDSLDLGDREAVVDGLAAMIASPLGPLAEGLRLRDFACADRLDELSFELPLAGGDTPTGQFDVSDIAGLLTAHLPPSDPLAGYPSRLADPGLDRTLRGYLTGSLDLVLRVAGTRFVVCDYKTNWLGPWDEPLTAWNYRPAAMIAAMEEAHYPLQAILYSVALHRYLRWRLPGYDARVNLGGVLYLFARGMSGAEHRVVAGQPCGVFVWQPPPELIEALSDLFDRGEAGTVTDTALDAFDARLVRGSTGLLSIFNVAGVLDAADVHVALRLGRIGGVDDEEQLLAAAFAVRGPRLGHVRTDLAAIASTADADLDLPVDVAALPWPEPGGWVARMAASELAGPNRPLRLEGTALYLDRYWAEEVQVAADLLARSGDGAGPVDTGVLADGLGRLFTGDDEPDLQRIAAATAVLRRLAVVAGGPGTGKTTTVARILALIDDQAAAAGGRPPLVALAAPTGKASARLEQAVHEQAGAMPIDVAARRRLLTLRGTTLHRLLGSVPGSHTRFRHNRLNRLPHDVVVVDETSMVSLSHMARLLEAIRPDARLVLVGDPQQLASVEAGAVLGDIVGPAADGVRLSASARNALIAVASAPPGPAGPASGIGDGIVVLRRVHRFGEVIGNLADAIRRGDADGTMRLVDSGADEVQWVDCDVSEGGRGPSLPTIRSAAVDAGRRVRDAAEAGDAKRAITALGAFRLLCAHRRGPAGATTWMANVERWLAADTGGFTVGGVWYPGRPLLITANDYSLRLFNGDTGVVVARADGRMAAAFDRQGEVVEVSPARLASVETVYAMTVHKAQGSQFETVAVLLPSPDSPILTRELLYTAVSRASHRVMLVGSKASIRSAVERPIARASGLRDRLWSGGS